MRRIHGAFFMSKGEIMARQSRIQTVPVNDIDDQEPQDLTSTHNETIFDDEAPHVNESLQSLYAEMEIDGDMQSPEVFVSKLNFDGKGNEARIWKGDPEAYSLEELARQHGTGSYRVKLYVRIPSGQKVQKAQKVFSYKLTREEEAALVAPLNVTPQAQPINAHEIAEMVARTMSQQMAQVIATTQRQQPAQTDPFEMMQRMSEIMRNLQPPQAAGGGLGQMRDMVELMGMMRELEPGGGGGAGTMDVLKTMVEKFGPAIAGIVAQNQAQQAAQMTQALPQPTAQPQPQQTNEDEMRKVQEMQLKMGLAYLVKMATANADPATYAGVIMDNVPPDELNQLLAVPGGPVAALEKIDPAIANFRPWFEEVVTEIKAILADTAEPDQTDQPNGGES